MAQILVFCRSELNGCKKYTAPDIVYSLSAVANQPEPLKTNSQARCSPPYELLCAPPPFGWLRQVRYRVLDRQFHELMLVGWYLFWPASRRKEHISSPSALSGPGFFCVVGWMRCFVTNLLCFPFSSLASRPNSCGWRGLFLCGMLLLVRAPRFLDKLIYFSTETGRRRCPCLLCLVGGRQRRRPPCY